MANGRQVHSGAVAMNHIPLGTRFYSPTLDRHFVVEDRIGHGTEFDIWFPSCDLAVDYGRRNIVIVREG